MDVLLGLKTSVEAWLTGRRGVECAVIALKYCYVVCIQRRREASVSQAVGTITFGRIEHKPIDRYVWCCGVKDHLIETHHIGGYTVLLYQDVTRNRPSAQPESVGEGAAQAPGTCCISPKVKRSTEGKACICVHCGVVSVFIKKADNIRGGGDA